jgi:hypothetical protein
MDLVTPEIRLSFSGQRYHLRYCCFIRKVCLETNLMAPLMIVNALIEDALIKSRSC